MSVQTVQDLEMYVIVTIRVSVSIPIVVGADSWEPAFKWPRRRTVTTARLLAAHGGNGNKRVSGEVLGNLIPARYQT